MDFHDYEFEPAQVDLINRANLELAGEHFDAAEAIYDQLLASLEKSRRTYAEVLLLKLYARLEVGGFTTLKMFV